MRGEGELTCSDLLQQINLINARVRRLAYDQLVDDSSEGPEVCFICVG